MTLENFKPKLWAGMLLKNLNNSHVAKACVNTDYEGEIKNHGDTVQISSIGRITIGDYTRNTDMSAPELLDGASQTLRIDQAKNYHFYLDDIDQAQTKPKLMNDAMKEAAWGIADVCDTFVFHEWWRDTATDNKLTPADMGTGAADGNIYETLVDLARILDENNTPTGGRFAILTPKMLAELRKDPRFSSFGTEANRKVARGASIGELAEFDIKMSNNVPRSGQAAWESGGFNIGLSAGDEVLLVGYKGAITFAEQIVKTEGYSPERRFGDAMKGLHVYGAKVTRPRNIAHATFGYA